MKICYICCVNKTVDEFVKDKTKRDGIRNYCKACHKENMNCIRMNDPSKHRDISKKSYHKNFKKNREKKNETARNNYNKNKSAIIKKQLDKYWSKRDLRCIVCKNKLPKHSIRYCNNCREEGYKNVIHNWRNRVGKDYINELQNKLVRSKVERLTDGYIASQIRGSKIPGWKLEQIPKHIIDLKRRVIQLKREIKNKIQ